MNTSIKAVVFDIGKTLIQYNMPLNWSSLYRPALENVMRKCKFIFTEDKIASGIEILTKYNTRVNPREYEVSSEAIFGEILTAWEEEKNVIPIAKDAFYSYFRQDSYQFEDVEDTLIYLRQKGIKIATLSDVAYGMDNTYVHDDIAAIINYIDLPFTSNDVGYRKPGTKGLEMIAERFGIGLHEIMLVGDEQKDIECANNAGAYSVLVNRSEKMLDYDQKATIQSISQLRDFI